MWGPIHLQVPLLSSWDPVAFGLTGIALALVFWLGWGPLRTLGVCAVLGLLATLLF